jgi:hypothetical protein
MKKLSTYLFLIFFSFQTPSWADDISDFEIEGMSIGDSLLDYFSKKEIKDNTNTDYYTNNEYTSVEFFELPSFEIYNAVEFNYKTDDKKYIIAAIGGTVFCEKNIEKCNKKQKEIDLELSNVFKNAKRVDDKGKHGADKSGKSTFVHINFWLISGDIVTIEILDWSKKITNEKRWTDNVNVSFRTKEFNDFLKIAFK